MDKFNYIQKNINTNLDKWIYTSYLVRDLSIIEKSILEIDIFIKKFNYIFLDKEYETVFETIKLQELICKLVQCDLKTLFYLKTNNYNVAFEVVNELNNIYDIIIFNLKENTKISGEFNFDFELIKNKIEHYNTFIFPKVMYCSTGISVLEQKCNICNLNKCNHVPLLIYRNTICIKTITKHELLEISLTENPINRNARQLNCKFNNNIVDIFTLLPYDRD